MPCGDNKSGNVSRLKPNFKNLLFKLHLALLNKKQKQETLSLKK
jgi:hypothetical protein